MAEHRSSVFPAAGKSAVLVAITAALSLVPAPSVGADTPTKINASNASNVKLVTSTDTSDQQFFHFLAERRRSVKIHKVHKRTVKKNVQSSVCTAANWQSTMTADEMYIDTRESTLNPYASNGQYHGLGQLGSEYSWTGDPCQQLADQRDYIAKRYGSEDAAVSWREGHGWY